MAHQSTILHPSSMCNPPFPPPFPLPHTHTLKSEGGRVSGMTAYGPPAEEDDEPFPLRWGEVIPLHFLTSAPLPSWARVMVLSQPSRRYADSVAMIPELLQLGRVQAPSGGNPPPCDMQS